MSVFRPIVLIIMLLALMLQACSLERRAQKNASKAFELYAKGEKYRSAQVFDKLYTKFSESDFTGKNLYNAATVYMEIDSSNLAIARYKELLTMSLDDNDKDSSRSVWETRTNYKHHACINLGKMRLKQDIYDSALKHFINAKTTYPYFSDSVKSKKRQAVELDRLIARCYLEKGDYNGALAITLNHALTNSPWNRHPAKDRAIQIIQKHFDPSSVLAELELGFKQIRSSSSFAQFPWRNHIIVLVPYENTSEHFNEENLLKSSLYIDLYRLVHFE